MNKKLEEYTIGIDPYSDDKSDFVNNLGSVEIIRNNILLQKAVEVLCNTLREDKSEGSYYHSWVCNLKMVFYDQLRYDTVLDYETSTEEEILKSCEEAAKNFLNLLINK